MGSDVDEARRLIAASGFNQTELADQLSQRLKRSIKGYTLSRIVSGERKRVEADIMDGLRGIVAGEETLPHNPSERAPHFLHAPRLTDTGVMIPLFGAVGLGADLRLGEGNMVGTVPLHPAQQGAVGPFAFVVPDNRLADRLMRGETAYALRGRHPTPGRMCLVELKEGEAQTWIYDGEDDNTLFLRQLQPTAKKAIAKRDIMALYPIVGVTFATA